MPPIPSEMQYFEAVETPIYPQSEPSPVNNKTARNKARRNIATNIGKRTSRTDHLHFWHDVTLHMVKQSAPDFTSRQLAVFMSVYLDKEPHTIRSLAAKLGVTKAVIGRAVDRLCKAQFVIRAADPADKRSVILKRTSLGVQYLQDFADIIGKTMP